MFTGIDQTRGKTEAVFARLRERAAQSPPELTHEWFDQGLFKTRSTQVMDYLAEAERNANALHDLRADSPVYGFMNNVVQQQLSALVQALYCPS